MADPELATSHTKRISYAEYDYPSTSDPVTNPNNSSTTTTTTPTPTVLNLHIRRSEIKEFTIIPLDNLSTARSIIASKLDSLSTSPTRVVLLNDEARVDMPEVSLDELEKLVREETVLGSGRGRQLFVIVYDCDPTISSTGGGGGGHGGERVEVGNSSSGWCEGRGKIPYQGRRREVRLKDCCVVL